MPEAASSSVERVSPFAAKARPTLTVVAAPAPTAAVEALTGGTVGAVGAVSTAVEAVASVIEATEEAPVDTAGEGGGPIALPPPDQIPLPMRKKFAGGLSLEERGGLEKRMWTEIDRLPQRDSIEQSDARQWIDTVIFEHADRALWHVVRLGGFGGSEIGALVRNRHGLIADHQVSARDIVESKLMRKAPQETRAQMARGNENELLHAKRFYCEMGALRDQAAYDRLSLAKGKHAWMRYSPDDVVVMHSSNQEWTRGFAATRPVSRWLIDYKAPTEVEPSDAVAFQYACQLAQGAILCEESGIELHGLMLSQFDWKNWALKNDVVVGTPELCDLVRDAGDWAWQYVLDGHAPNYVRSPRLDGMEDFLEAVEPFASQYAHLHALAAAATERAGELRKAFVSHLGKHVRFDGAKLDVPAAGRLTAARIIDAEKAAKLLTPDQLAAVSKADGYDEKKMAAFMREREIDLKQFRKTAIDATKLSTLAPTFGIDADSLISEQIRFAPDPEIVASSKRYVDVHYPKQPALQVDQIAEVMAAAATTRGELPALTDVAEAPTA